MAATQTVPQHFHDCNSLAPIAPRHGVITLFGYGIGVRVDRGHLIVDDGIGPIRRHARFPRVNHGLSRLVIIGADGFVSLGALRWLADQDTAFVMLDRDGSVLATTGPVRPSDARLRRAQGLAHQSGAAIEIARELISRKLDGQEKLARDGLGNTSAAEEIGLARSALADAKTVEVIRLIESRAALAYWGAWRTLPVNFPKRDVSRVPDHWKTFGGRVSPLTRSPRLATNPPNAMLNYLYALLESETRLAVAALGLDPGLGVLHVDAPARDSLAFDVMEPIRPQVDAYVLRWITHEILKREWFFEERKGNARLMGTFAARLCETLPTWGRAVAPIAELVARNLWAAKPKPASKYRPLATRLTQSHKREAKGCSVLPALTPLRPPTVCRTCGASIKCGRVYCASCGVTASREGLIEAAKVGRLVAHSAEVRARQAEKQRQHNAAAKAWKLSDKPEWLTEDAYREQVQTRLSGIPVGVIASALDVSQPYATHIRKGTCIPHPRHWQTLARLVVH
jgi:CRISPR-associated endonuclease Cas1